MQPIDWDDPTLRIQALCKYLSHVSATLQQSVNILDEEGVRLAACVQDHFLQAEWEWKNGADHEQGCAHLMTGVRALFELAHLMDQGGGFEEEYEEIMAPLGHTALTGMEDTIRFLRSGSLDTAEDCLAYFQSESLRDFALTEATQWVEHAVILLPKDHADRLAWHGLRNPRPDMPPCSGSEWVDCAERVMQAALARSCLAPEASLTLGAILDGVLGSCFDILRRADIDRMIAA